MVFTSSLWGGVSSHFQIKKSSQEKAKTSAKLNYSITVPKRQRRLNLTAWNTVPSLKNAGSPQTSEELHTFWRGARQLEEKISWKSGWLEWVLSQLTNLAFSLPGSVWSKWQEFRGQTGGSMCFNFSPLEVHECFLLTKTLWPTNSGLGSKGPP